jgi:hypothetical protein
LLLREDRDILIDLGIQEKLFKLIFSYELPWIHLSLEMIFDETIIIPPSSSGTLKSISKTSNESSNNTLNNTTNIKIKSTSKNQNFAINENVKYKNTLRNFIQEKMLSNKKITEQYTKQQLQCKIETKKLKDQIQQHLIHKFLSFVLFLDLARKKQILGSPTLFQHKSEFKVTIWLSSRVSIRVRVRV